MSSIPVGSQGCLSNDRAQECYAAKSTKAALITTLAVGIITAAIGTLAIFTLMPQFASSLSSLSSVGSIGWKGALALIGVGGGLTLTALVGIVIRACKQEGHRIVTEIEDGNDYNTTPSTTPMKGKQSKAVTFAPTFTIPSLTATEAHKVIEKLRTDKEKKLLPSDKFIVFKIEAIEGSEVKGQVHIDSVKKESNPTEKQFGKFQSEAKHKIIFWQGSQLASPDVNQNIESAIESFRRNNPKYTQIEFPFKIEDLS